MNYRKFIHPDSNGNSWGIVSAEQLWASVYALKYNRPEKPLDRNVWQSLFAKAKKAALEFGATSIGARVRMEYQPELFQQVLKELGFSKKSGRIEYQCDIPKLPNEIGSPLNWKTADELQWGPKEIANFTAAIIEGALDIEPDEKPEDFVQDWLHHEEFTSGAGCIAIGFFENEPCALVVAQINKDTGWSRISYMGILPGYRGKRFGKWVHRHGFTMMKQQGGKLYHGGTHINNFAMRKLFENHGCHVYCQMEEWSCDLKGGSDEAT